MCMYYKCCFLTNKIWKKEKSKCINSSDKQWTDIQSKVTKTDICGLRVHKCIQLLHSSNVQFYLWSVWCSLHLHSLLSDCEFLAGVLMLMASHCASFWAGIGNVVEAGGNLLPGVCFWHVKIEAKLWKHFKIHSIFYFVRLIFCTIPCQLYLYST